jgi:hypothetical protein
VFEATDHTKVVRYKCVNGASSANYSVLKAAAKGDWLEKWMEDL